MPKIALLAGEVSGDVYGAVLAEKLRQARPDVFLIGTGGERMRARGVRILADFPSGTMGFSGVLAKLPAYARTFRKVRTALVSEKPDIVVFIDNPGFNLRLAGTLGRVFPCYYYIPPKVWAHGAGRAEIVRKHVRAVIPIFPFETPLWRGHGVPCYPFGHPVTDIVDFDPDTGPLFSECRLQQHLPVLGILPGSREEEVKALMPVFLSLLRMLRRKREIQAVFSAVDGRIRRIEEHAMGISGQRHPIWEGGVHALVKTSCAVLAASGTVNLEIALMDRTFLVFYRTSRFNYAIARRVVKLRRVSPVNILLGKPAVPEFLQTFPLPEICRRTEEILDRGDLFFREKEAFRIVRAALPERDVSGNVARFLIRQCCATTSD